MARARRLGAELRALREGPLSSCPKMQKTTAVEYGRGALTDWRHWRTDAASMGSTCPSDARKRIFDCRIKGNQRSKKYHHPGCPSYDSISTKNVAKLFCSEDEARAEGYIKAGNCPP